MNLFWLLVVLLVVARGEWLIRAEPVCMMLALLRWLDMTER